MAAPVLIVTGAGSGIGAAVARLAGERGARVILCGRRRDPLAAVAESISGAIVHVADVTAPGGVEGLVGAAVDAYGRIDAVVANAGVLRPGGLLDQSREDWQLTMDTNVTSVLMLAKAAMPYLLESRGSLVTVGSIAGLRASAGAVAYATSKAAVAMLTQAIAVEFGSRGVRANVVAPGWVRTEMADEEMREYDDALPLDEAYGQITALVPQRRAASSEEVANAVLWLAGPEASYVNGAVLTVDGGTTVIDPGTVAYDFRLTPRLTEDR